MAWVKNAKGTVHAVPDEWLEAMLRDGFKEATPDEIRAWYEAQGLTPPEPKEETKPDEGGVGEEEAAEVAPPEAGNGKSDDGKPDRKAPKARKRSK